VNKARALIVAMLVAGLLPLGLAGVWAVPKAIAATTGTPTVSVGSGSVVEGASGSLTIRFPVTLSVPASSTVTVAYATTAGSAVAGKDYVARSGTLSLIPSKTTGLTPIEAIVAVAVLPDKSTDGTETFSLTLSNPTGGYILGNATGTGTIYDEATGLAGVQVNIGDASLYEGYSGIYRSVSIPVTLSAAATSPVSVDWVFTGGTALWGTDYKGTQYGTLTFAAGQRSLWLPVSVIPDADVGPDTTIVLTISNPTGGVIGRSSGTIVILDGQGGIPDLSVANSLPPIWEHTPFVYTVTITDSGNGPASSMSVSAKDPGLTWAGTITPGWTCGNLGGYRVPHQGWYCNSNLPVFPGAPASLQINVSPGVPEQYAETVSVATSLPQQNRVAHSFSDEINIGVPPVPAAPTTVQVSQTDANLDVSWTAPSTGSSSVVKSTITAVPSSGATLMAVVAGELTSGSIDNVQASMTYSVTVTSTSYAGTGPASSAVSFTTEVPTVPPGVPPSVTASWAGSSPGANLVVAWGATNTGNSPIDSYEIHAVAVNSETTPPPLDAVTPAPASSYSFVSPDSTVNWQVTVRAHNGAGWGPWSAPVTVTAID
jgi:chitinase